MEIERIQRRRGRRSVLKEDKGFGFRRCYRKTVCLKDNGHDFDEITASFSSVALLMKNTEERERAKKGLEGMTWGWIYTTPAKREKYEGWFVVERLKRREMTPSVIVISL